MIVLLVFLVCCCYDDDVNDDDVDCVVLFVRVSATFERIVVKFLCEALTYICFQKQQSLHVGLDW